MNYIFIKFKLIRLFIIWKKIFLEITKYISIKLSNSIKNVQEEFEFIPIIF